MYFIDTRGANDFISWRQTSQSLRITEIQLKKHSKSRLLLGRNESRTLLEKQGGVSRLSFNVKW